MGVFTTALAVAGVGLQAYGQYKAGKDAQSAANYNAAVYQQQAQAIEVKKGLTRQQYDRLIKKLSGSTVTAIAKSGYDFSGSFLEVMNDNLTQAQLEKQTEIYNLEVEQSQTISAANEERRAGVRARSAGNIGALSTIFTAGAGLLGKYGGGGTAVIPGKGGYGLNTPSGVRNMGTWSKF